MAHGRLINIGAFRAQYQNQNQKIDHAWVQDLPCEMLMNDFAGWEPEVLHLLQVNILSSRLWIVLIFSQCVQKATRWAVHTTVPLRTFVFGRVALLGDAVSWHALRHANYPC